MNDEKDHSMVEDFWFSENTQRKEINKKETNDEILKELKINKGHLDDESLNNPLLVQKYLNIYFKLLEKLNIIQIEYDELYSKRMRYYKTEYKYIPENVTELKILLNGDEELNKKKRELNNINFEIHKSKEIVQQFKDRQWAIKNTIDFLKFTMGDVN